MADQSHTTNPTTTNPDDARRRDERLFAAIEESMPLVRQSLDQWNRTSALRESVDPVSGHDANRSEEERAALWERSGLSAMYDDYQALDTRARASAWVAFRSYPKTLEGLRAKVAFDEFLKENVKETDLETWLHTDDWPGDQLSEDIACIMSETRRRPGQTAVSVHKAPECAPCTEAIRKDISTLHDLVGEADTTKTTLGKLIEGVGGQDAWRQTTLEVWQTFDHTIVMLEGVADRLHEASRAEKAPEGAS